MANIVANMANLMSEATVPHMGRPVTNAKVLTIFKAVCHSKVTAKMVQSPHQSKKSQLHLDMVPWGATVARAKEVANINNRRRRCSKKPPKQNAYAVMFKNLVPSEVTTTSGGERENHRVKYHQRWSFQDHRRKVRTTGFLALQFTVKCLKAPTLRVSLMEGLYTDTDPDDRSEIITDITIRMPGKAGTMMMEVKVDPGAQPSCIPLHKFKTLFPHLCRDGLPKEGLLDNTQNEFQSYNGGDMTCYGHLLIDVKDKVTKKYHPIRFYVMNTDVPRILISHAASYWLGLVKVLCDNKAPRIKRQVASIDKKSDF